MKIKNKILLFLSVIVLFLGFSSVTYAYGYFDVKQQQSPVNLTTGIWDNPFVDVTYFTGFEAYTNTNTSFVGQFTIDGIVWNTKGVVRGNTVNDHKFDTQSVRFSKQVTLSYIDSASAFVGLKSVSFYMGKTIDSPATGKIYNISIKDATSNWYVISTGAMPAIFTYFQFDIEAMITSGITLSNNVVVTSSTPLFIRVDFDGRAGGSTTRQDMNLDDLTIVYHP
jgi:hypothetical protein